MIIAIVLLFSLHTIIIKLLLDILTILLKIDNYYKAKFDDYLTTPKLTKINVNCEVKEIQRFFDKKN